MTFELLGGVVGGLIVFVVIGGELLFAHRRRQAEQAARDLEVEVEDLWERVARDVDRRRAEMNAIARETDQFPKGRQ